MVKNARKKSGASNIRPLNKPLAIAVLYRNDGSPITLKLRDRWMDVESLTDMWRIEDEWWRKQPIARSYYQCTVDKGIIVTVFQDLHTRNWYMQRM